MTVAAEIPLFPLNTVLFPGGVLPLRIFEPRYLDMISACLSEGGGFGICLIRSGSEVGPAAQPERLGTRVEIIDWDQLPDGLLGITVRGRERIRVLRHWLRDDQLAMAEVVTLPNEAPSPLPAPYQAMASLLGDWLDELGPPYATLDRQMDDAVWVSQRVAELLPMDPRQRQQLLEMDDAAARLELLGAMLNALIRQGQGRD